MPTMPSSLLPGPPSRWQRPRRGIACGFRIEPGGEGSQCPTRSALRVSRPWSHRAETARPVALGCVPTRSLGLGPDSGRPLQGVSRYLTCPRYLVSSQRHARETNGSERVRREERASRQDPWSGGRIIVPIVGRPNEERVLDGQNVARQGCSSSWVLGRIDAPLGCKIVAVSFPLPRRRPLLLPGPCTPLRCFRVEWDPAHGTHTHTYACYHLCLRSSSTATRSSCSWFHLPRAWSCLTHGR
ncbi:hypothetical protein VTK73DRAFT_2595 [Phialemonium thermophilum]|uniref:Uncharacterized protein n=1 Tax=Phialemonium thermophilum TaxID=223376 RepID=A0ABR3VRP3_9PEZI